eukprot:TRINITY_DN67017_c1_g1_i1.p2 TRINITY_DN67017_c1_g1~~TRINITY_DN67017_c1_g1_i1.p2  ORF type:complete len:163 (-),score=20.68 TRINITY_DN67017_c1_g1_i1:1487-1975(-)
MGANTSQPVDYDFDWDLLPRKREVGMGSADKLIAQRVEVGMGHAKFVVARRLEVGMGHVREAIVFDRLEVGMGKVGTVHCRSSTRIETGLSTIANVQYHHIDDLIKMAKQACGLTRVEALPEPSAPPAPTTEEGPLMMGDGFVYDAVAKAPPQPESELNPVG